MPIWQICFNCPHAEDGILMVAVRTPQWLCFFSLKKGPTQLDIQPQQQGLEGEPTRSIYTSLRDMKSLASWSSLIFSLTSWPTWLWQVLLLYTRLPKVGSCSQLAQCRPRKGWRMCAGTRSFLAGLLSAAKTALSTGSMWHRRCASATLHKKTNAMLERKVKI